jgi:hypothetical protein
VESRRLAFAGAYGKLDRADEHFKALQAEIETFVQGQTDGARGELQDIDGQTFYVMEAHTVAQVPDRIGLILGDAIQNLRSALDHTVWQLVLLGGGKPDKRNQFPIFSKAPTTPREIDSWERSVRGISGSDLALIEGVQPHRRPDPSTQPLAVLSDLSNTDKHRVILTIVLTIVLAPDRMPHFTLHDLEVLDQMRITYNQRLKPGTEIFRVPVRVTGPDPHMEMEGSLPAGVAFGEAEYAGEGLNMMRRYMRKLVEAFEDPHILQAAIDRFADERSQF